MATDIRTLRLRCTTDAAGRAAALASDDYVLNAPRPLNRQEGRAAFGDALLATLADSFPTGQERLDILLSGSFAGGEWTAGTGHLAGIFAAPLWGIPATGLTAFLRFGRFDRWVGGRMAETFPILDANVAEHFGLTVGMGIASGCFLVAAVVWLRLPETLGRPQKI